MGLDNIVSKMRKINKIYLITIRYLILLGFMFSIGLIYLIFTKLTINSVAFLLRMFFEEVVIKGNIIVIGFDVIQIVPACVAGSAYLLLLILNLTVPMKLKKRIKFILLSFAILFVLNVLRIVFLASLYVNGSVYFDFSHKLFWYGLSTVFVVGIWFGMVRVFKIKKIPVYTDVLYFLKEIKKGSRMGKKK